MNQNVIQFAYWITRIGMGLVILGLVLVVGLLAYWHIDPSYFDHWYLISPFEAGTAKLNVRVSQPPFDTGIRLNDIKPSNIYWLCARSLVSGGLIFWGLRIVSQVINSVKSQQTFYEQNVTLFKQLGLVGLLYALLVTFNLGYNDEVIVYYFTIPFFQIVFAVGCYVLAVVFEEGNSLHKDTKSII